DESIVPRPLPKHKPTVPASKDRARYTANGKEISKAEYDALALSARAYDLVSARKYTEALTLLESAERMAPECANVHCNMGVLFAKLGRRSEGIEHLKKAVACDSESPAPLGLLGSAYQGNGMLKEAILTYREYVKRFPKDGDMVMLKALIRDLEDDLHR